MKIRDVRPRKILIFDDIFVNAALVWAVRELKTRWKQRKSKEGNLNFPKLFSDWKNIKYQES